MQDTKTINRQVRSAVCEAQDVRRPYSDIATQSVRNGVYGICTQRFFAEKLSRAAQPGAY